MHNGLENDKMDRFGVEKQFLIKTSKRKWAKEKSVGFLVPILPQIF